MPQEILLSLSGAAVCVAVLLTWLAVSRHERKNAAEKEAAQKASHAQVQAELNEQKISEASIRERLEAREATIVSLEHRVAELTQVLEAERTSLMRSRERVSVLETSLTEQQQQSEEKLRLLNEARESLQDGFRNLANEIFESKQKEFKSQSSEQLSNVLNPLRERIQAFEKRVEESYASEAKERFSLIREVKSLQELNSRIAQDAVNLTNALKGENKTQGIWGEMVLEKVLESSGLEKGREYETQVSLKQEDGKRLQPDAIVRLPEGKDVIVDSKVSLTAYERYSAAETDEDRALALKEHVQSIRTHIRSLSDKEYQSLAGIRTLDYVLLFIPIESAFSVAAQYDEALYMDALGKQIAIVTPATLLATLRTIQNMWRIDQQNRNAEEIADKAGKLYDKFVSFVSDLELIGSRLESTQGAYRDAFNKLASGRGNLVKRAEDMKALGAKVSKSLPQNLVEMPSRETTPPLQSVDR